MSVIQTKLEAELNGILNGIEYRRLKIGGSNPKRLEIIERKIDDLRRQLAPSTPVSAPAPTKAPVPRTPIPATKTAPRKMPAQQPTSVPKAVPKVVQKAVPRQTSKTAAKVAPAQVSTPTPAPTSKTRIPLVKSVKMPKAKPKAVEEIFEALEDNFDARFSSDESLENMDYLDELVEERPRDLDELEAELDDIDFDEEL